MAAMNVRITSESPFILMLSQGVLSAREVLGAQQFRIFAPREGWFSIHGSASGSVPKSFMPSSAGHVRRRLVVQSSETPVVDMTASINSAPADPPPPVWNEGSVGQESDTDSLMSFKRSHGPGWGKQRWLWKRKFPSTISGCLQHSTTVLPVWMTEIWRQSFATLQQ